MVCVVCVVWCVVSTGKDCRAEAAAGTGLSKHRCTVRSERGRNQTLGAAVVERRVESCRGRFMSAVVSVSE